MITDSAITAETPVAALSVGQFQNLMDSIINSSKQENEVPVKEIMDKNECVNVTGYSKNTLNKFICNREIPYYKKNGRVFFKRSEILAWLLSNRVKTGEEFADEQMSRFAKKRRK